MLATEADIGGSEKNAWHNSILLTQEENEPTWQENCIKHHGDEDIFWLDECDHQSVKK